MLTILFHEEGLTMINVRVNCYNILALLAFLSACSNDNNTLNNHTSDVGNDATLDLTLNSDMRDQSVVVKDLSYLDMTTDMKQFVDADTIDMKQFVDADTIDMMSDCKPALGTTLPVTEADAVVILGKWVDGEVTLGNGGARTAFNQEFTITYQREFDDISTFIFDSVLSANTTPDGVVKLEGTLAWKEGTKDIVETQISECITSFGDFSTINIPTESDHNFQIIFNISKSN